MKSKTINCIYLEMSREKFLAICKNAGVKYVCGTDDCGTWYIGRGSKKLQKWALKQLLNARYDLT